MNPFVAVGLLRLPGQGDGKPLIVCLLMIQLGTVKGDRRRQQQVAGIANTGNQVTPTLK